MEKKRTSPKRNVSICNSYCVTTHTHECFIKARLYSFSVAAVDIRGCVKIKRQRKRGTRRMPPTTVMRETPNDCVITMETAAYTNAIENRRVIVTRACTINIGHDGAAERVLRASGRIL